MREYDEAKILFEDYEKHIVKSTAPGPEECGCDRSCETVWCSRDTLGDGTEIDRCIRTDGLHLFFEISAGREAFEPAAGRSFVKYLESNGLRLIGQYSEGIETEHGRWNNYDGIDLTDGKVILIYTYTAKSRPEFFKKIPYIFDGFEKHVASWKMADDESGDPSYFIEGISTAVMDDGIEVELCLWHDNEINRSLWDVSTDKKAFDESGEPSFTQYLKKKGLHLENIEYGSGRWEYGGIIRRKDIYRLNYCETEGWD